MTRSKRHKCSIWLAAWWAFVSALSLWWDQSLQIHSSCCFTLSCPKMSCGPISALDGRVAESFVVPSLLKSEMQVAVTHAAAGAGHEVYQSTLRENEDEEVLRSHTHPPWLGMTACDKLLKRKKSSRRFENIQGNKGSSWRQHKRGKL